MSLCKLRDILLGRFLLEGNSEGVQLPGLNRPDDPYKDDPYKVVFVVGAGASLESGMSTWEDKDLRRRIIKAMARPYGTQRAFVEEAWTQLTPYMAYGSGADKSSQKERLIDYANTEQLCGVACLTARGRSALITLLNKEFGTPKDGHDPQLGYELIAHFLKHRFADHVISLNFDEVLDASLCDELGEDGCCVVLPSYYQPSPLTDLPYLFKLHGTIGQPDSLRFAMGETDVLADQTIEVLNKIIPKETGLWVVSLGYSWNDVGLARWLQTREKLLGIIVVSLTDEAATRIESDLEDVDRLIEPEIRYQDAEILAIPTTDIVCGARDHQPATVDEILWAVWRGIRKIASSRTDSEVGSAEKRKRWVPSAARHLLISHMFPPIAAELRQWPAVYKRHNAASRCEAELFLAIGKAYGMLTLSAVARDTRISDRLLRLLKKRPNCSLADADFLSPIRFSEVTEVFLFQGTIEDDYNRFFEAKRSSKTKLKMSQQTVQFSRTSELYVPEMTGDCALKRTRWTYRQFLSTYLTKIVDGPEVEVDPGQDPRIRALLPKSKPLTTYKALLDCTNRLLTSDWKTLLVIAESGEWLTDYTDLLAGRTAAQVFLIEASRHTLDDWAPRIIGLPANKVKCIGMPWWEHNRHLTIAITKEQVISGGIYFKRRQKTPRISPVFVPPDAKRELSELLTTFMVYVARVIELHKSWEAQDCGHGRYNVEDFCAALRSELRFTRLMKGRAGGAPALLERLGFPNES